MVPAIPLLPGTIPVQVHDDPNAVDCCLSRVRSSGADLLALVCSRRVRSGLCATRPKFLSAKRPAYRQSSMATAVRDIGRQDRVYFSSDGLPRPTEAAQAGLIVGVAFWSA